ncbi:MAG: phosphoglycerate dehydrogenase-like enzyme [Alphaproteobacteria bacterium]|jgi:phosphoglycerate dehydrogenase-like enzyme
MSSQTLLVTYEASDAVRAIITDVVGTSARISYLTDLAPNARAEALATATALLARNTAKELQPGEAALLTNAKLLQFVSAGVDFIPMAEFPTSLAIAGNGGGYAEPMAEHAVMMTLAALKRLIVEHNKVAALNFDQFRANRMLAGSVCGILGFGGIGKATANLMRALGTEIHAINRSGKTDESVDWIGDESKLNDLLANSDILILSLPLTPASQNLIGASELAAMKKDAVLVNLARGEIIDEAALYTHLQENPTFTACLDAWWVEPVRHGHFEMTHNFTSLPNVIASPHNSASVSGWRDVAVRRACENVCRALDGGQPQFLVPPADRMM